jgi:glycerol-3-phosphate dehydrogenase (NAD(P)+)
MNAPQPLLVLGAGAWGTALAVRVAARGLPVQLWARDPEQRSELARWRCNRRYLPEHPFPDALAVAGDLQATLAAAIEQHTSLLVATPMAGLRTMLRAIGDAAGQAPPTSSRLPLAWLCKGFEADTALLGHELASAVLPGWPITVVSGPSFADEVARSLPTALVAASLDAACAQAWADVLHDGPLRVYTSTDPIGVEVGGAVKNVLAIATGVCDGLPPRGLGTNARAALITRGLAEMSRLGVALGARAETFMGLTGLGDLVLTATGELSRNRRVGLALAQGQALDEVLGTLGHVAEGVSSAPMVLARARALGVEMPITEALVELLAGRCDARGLVSRLLAREARAESA